MTQATRTVLDAAAIDAALRHMAHALVETRATATGVALLGIRTLGVPLAKRLARLVEHETGATLPVGVLDITLYRDDFTTIGSHAILRSTEIDFAITGADVVLVDDVLYTGRTVRAALDGVMDFGRPRRIRLAVLIDRGHRELPIHADFIGATIATEADEFVRVRLAETDGEDAVLVGQVPDAKAAPSSLSR